MDKFWSRNLNIIRLYFFQVFFMLKDTLYDDTARDAAGNCSKLNMLQTQPRIPGIFSCRRHLGVDACFSLLISLEFCLLQGCQQCHCQVSCTVPDVLSNAAASLLPTNTICTIFILPCCFLPKLHQIIDALILVSKPLFQGCQGVSLVLINTTSSKMSSINADSFTYLSIFATHSMQLFRLNSLVRCLCTCYCSARVNHNTALT